MSNIHKDIGKYGIEFTVNKMIPEFNKGAKNATSPGLTAL